MPAGCPRTVSYPPDEMIALGKEMLAWIEANYDTVLHVSDFYSLEKGISDSEWETMVRRAEFVGYYEMAKRRIGRKYLDKTSNVREGVSQRWQRIYFSDLRAQEDADMDADALRKKSVAESVDSAKLEQFAMWMEKFGQAQSQSVSNDLNSSNTESTS